MIASMSVCDFLPLLSERACKYNRAIHLLHNTLDIQIQYFSVRRMKDVGKKETNRRRYLELAVANRFFYFITIYIFNF